MSETPKGIAILGSNPVTVDMAPFDDPGWLIYACSPDNVRQRTLPRVNQWFEVHIPIADPSRPYKYLRALEDMDVECVWMRDKDAMGSFERSRPVPEKALKEEFGPFTFTSSIAFMLAQAIKDCEAQDIPQIGMWGILQASANEYSYQRPGLQNLIWEAAKRGIRVIAPDVSRLFEPQPENF